MRDRLICCMAAAVIAAACSDQLGPNRRLIPTLGASGDSSTDSIPGRRGGPVASVTVSPESATVAVGDSVGFFADLRDAAGNPARDANVKWSVADPSVARIEGEFGQSLILRALRRGSTTVTARTHGKSGTARLVVDSLPPPPPGGSVATVSVTPPADTAARGDTVAFSATLRDSSGNVLSGRSVSWTVSDSSVARIEAAFGQTVILRAQGTGSTVVTATSEGRSGSAQLFVTDSTPPPPPGDSVATVTVSPDTALAAVGDTVPFFATLRDAQGNPLSGRSVFWTVSDSTVARIDAASGPSVVVRALRSGSALVSATSEGKSGSGSLIVR